MPNDEIDLEELIEEGHALVNHGLTHFRHALEGAPVEFYALTAWLRGATLWIKETDPHQEIPLIHEVTENLTWLATRLTPRTPAGPANFLVAVKDPTD